MTGKSGWENMSERWIGRLQSAERFQSGCASLRGLRIQPVKKRLREPSPQPIVMPIVTPLGRLEIVVSLPPAAIAPLIPGSLGTPTGNISRRPKRPTIQYSINHGSASDAVGVRLNEPNRTE